MLLIEIRNDRYNDLIYSGDQPTTKQLYIVTVDNKKHGPFSDESAANAFISKRTDLKSPKKQWI